MSEKLKQSLSAVFDDEADEFELRRVLDEVAKNPELKQSWERYTLIGSVMRREKVAEFTRMRERVWSEVRLDEDQDRLPLLSGVESEVNEPASSVGPGRWASMAVAATVALAVIVGLGNIDNIGEFGTAPAPEVASSDESVGAQQRALNQAVALRDEVTPIDQNRVDTYKIFHTQQRGMNQSGFGAFAKMVSYQRD
jgi:sigma-E factor negative regulatory protein RseA